MLYLEWRTSELLELEPSWLSVRNYELERAKEARNTELSDQVVCSGQKTFCFDYKGLRPLHLWIWQTRKTRPRRSKKPCQAKTRQLLQRKQSKSENGRPRKAPHSSTD